MVDDRKVNEERDRLVTVKVTLRRIGDRRVFFTTQ